MNMYLGVTAKTQASEERHVIRTLMSVMSCRSHALMEVN